MKMIKSTFVLSAAIMLMLSFFPIAVLSSCSDDEEEVVVGDISAASGELTKTVAWDEVETCIEFTANTDWTATVDDVTTRAGGTSITWLKLTVPSGKGGTVRMPLLLSKNDNETFREAQVTITCGEKSVVVNIHQEANPNAVEKMDIADIPNYDKYYLPSAYNENFEKGAEGMLRSDAQWSWFRYKESEHFFVFWAPGFGNDPNSTDVPASLRVDIDDLLEKAEQFYKTNVETLKMVTVGEGKSQLDNYKMEIYLLYQTEWLATGSGYDNVIGALWVNPSTCQPVGSTIAHEIGHSFQYQVYCDKILNGEADDFHSGFRYGFGPDGAGGCSYWEQCAQWQSFQDYPSETFGYHIDVWKANHHRHFNHENMRYASYWLPYYWTEKHGIEAYGKIWQESAYPEDPIETYTRLYCGGSYSTFYDELYDYAARCVTYDFDAVHQYATESAMNYTTTMYKVDGYYRPAYTNCPGTTGFNVIPLNVPDAGTTVSADLKALAPGSSLAADDPGTIVDADGNATGTSTSYNAQTNTSSNYRIGFVSVAGGEATYGTMEKGAEANATYTVPAGTEQLYLVVVATPDTYNRHYWNDDETDDEQWPYEVKFSGTDLYGNVILPDGDPEDVAIEHEFTCDAAYGEYVIETLNLMTNGDMEKIAKAFRLQPAEIAAATIAAGEDVAPAEGKIAVGLTTSDGTISYAYSANGIGFWVDADGNASSWGDTTPIYFEYTPSAYSMDYGHHPGVTVAGTTYTMRPTMVYTKDGKEYKAVITITMKY